MRYTLRLDTAAIPTCFDLMCAMNIESSIQTERKTRGSSFPIRVVGREQGDPERHKFSRRYMNLNTETFFSRSSPAQLTNCPWCGHEIRATGNIKVDKSLRRTSIFCGDPRSVNCKRKSYDNTHPGLPVNVVDEGLYLRPP